MSHLRLSNKLLNFDGRVVGIREVVTTTMNELDRRLDALLTSHPPGATDAIVFLGAQFDAGLAFVQFPEGSGGLGLEPGMQKRVDDRLRARGRTHLLPPESDRLRHERADRAEPGAGSDLASLAARAVRDGDEWVVNGQKVWTSLAHKARFGMLLARTAPAVPKHAGLTYFVVDMHAPGVDVRPLRQLTGEAEFNEVFLEDVRIPDAERLGEVGAGWKVATTTLMFERFNTGAVPARGQGIIEIAMREWSKRPDTDTRHSGARRDKLVRAWILAEVHRLTNLRAAEKRERGVPGPEGSVGKLSMAIVNQAVSELALELTGSDGMLYPSGYELTRPETMGTNTESDAGKAFLRAQANSIEGGTSDIMRNILGERVLGLPPEPRVGKTMPSTEIPRS